MKALFRVAIIGHSYACTYRNPTLLSTQTPPPTLPPATATTNASIHKPEVYTFHWPMLPREVTVSGSKSVRDEY